MDGPDLVRLHVVDAERVLRLVVSQQHFVLADVDSLAADVVSEELLH
jgi:hypothetical protein